MVRVVRGWRFSCASAASSLLLLVAGCASPLVTAAERGDGSLAALLAERQRTGRLDAHEAAKVARAVAERELRAARGADARTRVREASVCAEDLDDALAARATQGDAAAADAARARLDAGAGSLAAAREHAAAAGDAERAWGVRGLVGDRFLSQRHRALLDPSPDVRRAALAATRAEPSAADGAPLLEVARVDPDLAARSDAVRVLPEVVLAAPALATSVVRALDDLWPRADGPLRRDIAHAWAHRALYTRGGRDALRARLAADRSEGATLAAGAALLAPQVEGDDVPDLARSRILQALAAGTRDERVRLAPLAPLPEAAPALRRLADEGEPDAAALALERLARLPAEKDAARRALELMASRKGTGGQPARLALASLGDRRVQAWLEEDLASPQPAVRVRGAQGLLLLGRAMRAAPLLVDGDASVRMRAACIVVQGARRGR